MVSRTVAYEARPARIFYGTNRGLPCAGNKENLKDPKSTLGRFWFPSGLLFAGETNRSVDRFVLQYTPWSQFRSRSTGIESATNICPGRGCKPQHGTINLGKFLSVDRDLPVQWNHAHEGKLHEDLHRGTVALTDGLSCRRGASPLRKIKYVFLMLYRWTHGPPIFPRTRELSNIG